MPVNVSFRSDLSLPNVLGHFCVILCDDQKNLSLPEAHSLKKPLQNFLAKNSLDKDESVLWTCPDHEDVFLIFNLGSRENLTPCKAADLGGALFARLAKHLAIDVYANFLDKEQILGMALGASLRSWRFDRYHTEHRPLPAWTCQSFCLITDDHGSCEKAFADQRHLADCIAWSRELINEPANVLYPQEYLNRLKSLETLGVQVQSLDEEAMFARGFHALLGVGQGSARRPYLVVLKWNGAGPEIPPIAFVGKGVTFDSGGISIKPSAGMEEMKMDMAGSAVVCGLIRQLALRKAKVNAVGVVALVENMPSGQAQKPGDIVTSLSGQTIEILDTDAEGRLILADALWYTQDQFHPSVMIDIATLTGAVRIALGNEFAGIFSNCQTLCSELIDSGQIVDEKLWQLPLCQAFDRALDGSNADIQNIVRNYGAGSSTAAQFLHRFIGEKVRWAHLDIASVDHCTKDTPLFSKGGRAFGLRLLDLWIRHHEQS